MSYNTKAVITLQIGHYSNFVGTHFWNAQDHSLFVPKDTNDLDHDVLFREGVTMSGNTPTYTPRLVSVDLKGALGSLPEFGDLYFETGSLPKTDLSAQASKNWHYQVDVQREETVRKSKFLQGLEASEKVDEEGKDICTTTTSPDAKHSFEDCQSLDQEVRLWSDYARCRYHPKTNVVLDHQHANANDPFDVYGFGTNAWNAISDEFEDRLRFFAEEADFLKGFQLLTDATDAFGGVSSSVCDFLQDDYNAQSILTFPTIPSFYHETMDALKSTGKMLNLALALRSLSENSNLITPLSMSNETFPLRGMEARSLPSINYNPQLHYNSSAVLSLAFDAMTLPWRMLKGPYASPSEVAAGLSAYGRKFTSMQLVAPFAKPFKDKLKPYLQTYNLSDSISLSPHTKPDFEKVWCQSVSVRGINGSENGHLDFLSYFDRVMTKTASAVTTSKCPVQLKMPFPVHMIGTPYWDPVDKTIPIMTLWQSSREAGNIIKILSERVAKINLSKFHRYEEAGLDQDTLMDTIEDLHKLSENYEPTSDAM